MDNRLSWLGFSSNSAVNAFENLGKAAQDGSSHSLGNDSIGSAQYLTISHGIKRKRSSLREIIGSEDESALVLDSGRSPSSSNDSKGSSEISCTVASSSKETDEAFMDMELDFHLHLGIDMLHQSKEPSFLHENKRGKRTDFDLRLSLSTGSSESDITSDCPFSINDENKLTNHSFMNMVTEEDEDGSTLPRRSSHFHQDFSSTKGSVTCVSGFAQSSRNSKTCQCQGCRSRAGDVCGLDASHGGCRSWERRRCLKGVCLRCLHLGCPKSAEGHTDFHTRHAHDGSKQCQKENYSKNAEVFSDFCHSHGEDDLCQFRSCSKGARAAASPMFCKFHGERKRDLASGRGDCKHCKMLGCDEGDPGHHGGKMCSSVQPPCDRFAKEKTGLYAARHALVEDKRVHGAKTIITDHLLVNATNWEKTREIAIEGMHEEVNTLSVDPKTDKKGDITISILHGWNRLCLSPYSASLPEGRVHGGRLMAMLSSGTENQLGKDGTSSSMRAQNGI